MKKVIPFLLFFSLSTMLSAQTITNITTADAPSGFENIHIEKLSSDSLSSSFIIWIKKGVKKHQHEHHTEQVYILEGEGSMVLGDLNFALKPGQFIYIPKQTPHKVTVTSTNPMKVLSIQSPMFTGKDRTFLE